MNVYRSGDRHHRKTVLQPLSSSGSKLHRIKFDSSPSSAAPPDQPEHTAARGDGNHDQALSWTGVTSGVGLWLEAIRAWFSSTQRAARHPVRVPLWAVGSLVAVLLSVTIVAGYTQFVDADSTSDNRQTSSSAESDNQDGSIAGAPSLKDLDLGEGFDDPPAWVEPDSTGMSKREEYLRSDGHEPASGEVRYASEEVERLQAELEAIQRNSAVLRNLARQQSGDLSAAYSSLEATQEQKDGALEDLQSRIDELEGRIQTVDELARELRDMLGLPELQSGVGGPSGDSDVAEGDPWLSLRADVVAIEQRAGELVFELDEVNTEIQLRLAQVRQTGLPDGGSVEANLQFYDTMPVGMPVDGPITSRFGLRGNPFGPGSDMHTGIDIAARTGTPVLATGGGTVRVASNQGGYGLLVIIDHGRGVSTWYGHNSRFRVSPGQRVNAGDVIAEVGSTGMSTGPHVHYEIRINNVPQDPLSLMQMER